MRCPRCGGEDSSVLESRGDGTTIRRRRECDSCHSRFTTYERIELSLPMVVKKDGRREAFDREKIRGGLVRACEKTAISMDEIERAVEGIEAKIAERCAKEIPSGEIGGYVMEYLRKADKIAYVRFASVYREFSDISQFVDMLHGLNEKSRKASRAAVRAPRTKTTLRAS